MQKKKKYYEIKDGGVTLYWDMTANMLVDIDVQPGVKTVNLFVEKTASQYLYSMYKIMLDNVYKQFPDVEELHIGDDISTVKIRNDMFPNGMAVILKIMSTMMERLDMRTPSMTLKLHGHWQKKYLMHVFQLKSLKMPMRIL